MDEGSVEEAFYLKKKHEEEKGGFAYLKKKKAFWDHGLKHTHAN